MLDALELDKEIKKMTQVIQEESRNRFNKYILIHQDISDTVDKDFLNKVSRIQLLIKQYLINPDKDPTINKLGTFNTVEDISYLIIESIIPNGTRAVPIQLIVSAIANSFKGFSNLNSDYDPFRLAEIASELIGLIVDVDIFDLFRSKRGSLMIKSAYALDRATLVKLDKLNFLPPMITKPKEIKTNKQGAHLTFDNHVVLGNFNRHNENQSLDVINILNSIELSLDTDILAMEEELDKDLNTPTKVTNFEILKLGSNEVYEFMLQNDNSFYFNWNYDFRGRSYSSGYHINFQSYQYKKACISLKHKELII